MKNVLAKIDELTPQYIALWEELCNKESPTNDKAGVDAAGELLLQIAKEKGFAVRCLPCKKAGNAFSISINENVSAPSVVFSGHIDTVHPVGSFGTPAVRTDNEKIYGPGVMDCKGGVVASLLALDALHQAGFNKRPVKLVVQTDEETSSKNSDKKTIDFMLEESAGALAFLNTEGIQGDTAVVARKGILRVRFTVLGKAMHSSKCFAGANAVLEAAHKIIQLEKLKDAAGITCNCGIIKGGSTPNSVADRCCFTADIRFATSEQYNEAVALCKTVAEQNTVDGCTCTIEKVSERPAMPRTAKNEQLLEKMNAIYARCGLPTLTARGCLSGSDAAYTTMAGIPTIDNLGVDGSFIHSVNEFAYLASLAQSAKRLAAVAYEIEG